MLTFFKAVLSKFPIVRTVLTFGKQLIQGVWDFILRNSIGDAYAAYHDPEKFLEELDHRSWESGTNIGIGHIGPVWQNRLPKLVYVSGSNNGSFRAIAQYGEDRTISDPGARETFKRVETLLQQKIINNLQGESAQQEKKLLKEHMSTAQSLDVLYDYTKNTFLKRLEETEHPSFPTFINHFVNSVLAHCVFGITKELDSTYTPEFMGIAKLITHPSPSSKELAAASERLRQISQEIFQNNLLTIDPNKYIAHQAKLSSLATEEEKIKCLQSKNIAGSFIAGTNLADLLMKTLVEISSNHHVKQHLMNELETLPHHTRQDLCALPYLNLIYLEAQRLYSPSLVARRCTHSFTLFTTDEKQRPQKHVIPAYSYLFAPIRPRHLSPYLWENPELFMPERFLGEQGKKNIKKLVTFSNGMRACPAQAGFTHVWFKTSIVTFFKQVKEIKLNKSVEPVSVFSLNTSWQEDYSASLTIIS